MQTEKWNRARLLFERLLTLPPSDHASFLAVECGDDATLLAELRDMQAAYDGDSFLERPPSPLPAPAVAFDAARPPVSIGPYRILDALGAGGMGVVYRGRHATTGELAAVKTVRVASETLLSGIRREIHALARLSHPGVVGVVDEGLDAGVPWYAMELVDGVSLRSLARLAPPLAATMVEPPDPDRGGEEAERPVAPRSAPARDLGDMLAIVRRLCETLAFVHGEGVVHRDLKPDNVLVRPSGLPVLVDFGIASSFAGREGRDAIDAVGEGLGTVAYMAPEQIRGELVDARADLYAFGCILYELLTGRPPFLGETVADFVRAHLRTAPVPPSAFAPGLPEALDALVLRLLAKSPAARIGYADDVAAALERLGAGGAPAPEWTRARAYLYRPAFAGRADTIAGLERRFAQPDARGVVLIGGESGTGKTRLAVELGRRAEAAEMRVLVGECPPHGARADGSGGPLGALRGPLRRVADRCRERGERETDALVGPRGPLLARYEPAIDGLPGQHKYPEPADLPPAAARLRLFEALARTFAETARPRPLLVVLDDLQWADELTLGFLEYLARGSHQDGGRVLVLGTYRSEEQPDALRATIATGRAVRVDLGRLEEDAVAAMVGGMLSLDPPPRVFSAYLSRQSEGNPFFVAEYLRAAVEEGLLWRDEAGAWQVGAKGAGTATDADYERLGLPRSVRALVERRLGGLDRDAGKVVSAAAVVGREADTGVLEEMVGLGGAPLLDALEQVLRRRILEEAGGGRLRFTHDKLREAAYDRISSDERARLHGAAARALRARPGPERPELAATLGHHWERAGEPDRASEYYLAGAGAARLQYANAEAIRLYRAHLALVRRPTAETVEARNALGNALRVHGRTAEAVEEHELALEEATVLGDRRGEGESAASAGDARLVLGMAEEALGHFERAIAASRAAGDSGAEAHALAGIAMISSKRGDFANARDLYERALALHRERGDRRSEGIVVRNLGILLVEQGRLEEGRACMERALALAREAGSRHAEGLALGAIAHIRSEQGMPDEAREFHEQALRAIREVGDRPFEGLTLNNLAILQADGGDVERAGELYEQALAIARESGAKREEGFVLSDLATLERRGGDLDRADGFLVEAEARFRDVGDRIYLALCACERGHAELARGRPATDLLEAVRERVSAIGARPESALGKAVSKLDRAVAARSAGGRLLRGECVEDVPAALLRRLREAETADG